MALTGTVDIADTASNLLFPSQVADGFNALVDLKYKPGEGVLELRTPIYSVTTADKDINNKSGTDVLTDYIIDKTLGTAAKKVTTKIPKKVMDIPIVSTMVTTGQETGKSLTKKIVTNE